MFEPGKYVDVLVGVHGTFLEHLSSGTLKFKYWKENEVKSLFETNKPKGTKYNS